MPHFCQSIWKAILNNPLFYKKFLEICISYNLLNNDFNQQLIFCINEFPLDIQNDNNNNNNNLCKNRMSIEEYNLFKSLILNITHLWINC